MFSSRAPAEILAKLGDAELVVLEFGASLATALPLFGHLRQARPDLRVVFALSGVEAWLAVELIKCGASDVVFLPAEADVLAKKIRRALEDGRWPAMSVPGLELAPSKPAQDRRLAFRVALPAGNARVVVPGVAGKQWIVQAIDLSLPQDRKPGGLAVVVQRDAARAPPFSSWMRGDSTNVALLIDDGYGALSLPSKIARIAPAPDGTLKVGLQFTLLTPQDERRVRQLWMSAQRTRSPR